MTDIEPSPPLVSVGIPLYRSRRFLEIIVENIEAIEYANVEIIISDRHLFDDTLEVLEDRYGSDPRFRFLAANDNLDWVENFNLLLRQSTGKYFLSMAHDDSFPSDYIGTLVSALEAHPDAILAFGKVEQISLDGFLPAFPFSPPPFSRDEAWTLASALRALTLWHLWIAFRGVVRREAVEKSNLYVRPTYRNIRADIYWVFGLSLKGRLCFVPSCHCAKRFYESSTGAGWHFGIRQSLNACRVLGAYLDDFSGSQRDRVVAKTVVYSWCLAQGLLPTGLARYLGITVRRLLLGSQSQEG
jgi:glycosyltransferase involved in cell wall biosynthesis